MESPFILLYLLELSNISTSGVVLPAYVLAVVATLLYLANGLLEAFGLVPHYYLINLSTTFFLEINYLLATSFILLCSSFLLIFMSGYISTKLKQKQTQIEKLSNAQVEFVHEVMHEVRSPLTSIIGYAEILSHKSLGEINEQQENSLAVIRRQSQHILNMSNDLLSIARIEAGKTKIEKNLTPISEIIIHTVEEMKPQFDEKNIELIQEINSSLPPVKIDEAKIHEVLTNLIANAIKFSKKGGRIFITTQLLPNTVQIAVRDEGRGIDIDDLPNVFNKFYRGSAEGTHRGTGLGLTLCKTIVQAHGGRIWATSSGPDKGSVFYFTLPLE